MWRVTADVVTKITFLTDTNLLTYNGTALEVKGRLRQEICKRVFKNRKKAVYYNDILDVVDANKQSRAVYDAVKAINKNIEKTFKLREVLVVIPDREIVRISQNYR